MDTPHIERPNTLSGLIEKHREVAGQIEHHRQIVNALVFDLEALEHTIRIFDPDANLGRAKPVPARDASFRGEMRRDILTVLRGSNGLLTSLDIARRVVMLRNLTEDHETVTLIRKRVGAALWKLKVKAVVVEVPQPGEYKGWRLA
ncbi:MAG TPA: hypothetical protein VF495_16550 [Phenylobacterium sp.]